MVSVSRRLRSLTPTLRKSCSPLPEPADYAKASGSALCSPCRSDRETRKPGDRRNVPQFLRDRSEAKLKVNPIGDWPTLFRANDTATGLTLRDFRTVGRQEPVRRRAAREVELITRSGGEGGILLPSFPVTAGESCTFAIIPCAGIGYKPVSGLSDVSIVSVADSIFGGKSITGISSRQPQGPSRTVRLSVCSGPPSTGLHITPA
jgi:hypothetical protein